MTSFKALAAAVLLSATAAAPAFAHTSRDSSLYTKNYKTPGTIRRTTTIRTGP